MHHLHTILSLVMAVVVLTASMGVPTMLHTCLGMREVPGVMSCCTEDAPEPVACCDESGVTLASVVGADDDPCCVETVVVHGIETTAVPGAHVETPQPSLAVLHSSFDATVGTHSAWSGCTAVRLPKAVPSPPSLQQIGILLL